MSNLFTLARRPHLRHLQQFDAEAAQPCEHRAYSHGYSNGFDAALELPIDHPLLEGLKEKLRASGWNEPSCVETASCADGDHTLSWPCDLAPGTGRYAAAAPQPGEAQA